MISVFDICVCILAFSKLSASKLKEFKILVKKSAHCKPQKLDKWPQRGFPANRIDQYTELYVCTSSKYVVLLVQSSSSSIERNRDINVTSYYILPCTQCSEKELLSPDNYGYRTLCTSTQYSSYLHKCKQCKILLSRCLLDVSTKIYLYFLFYGFLLEYEDLS